MWKTGLRTERFYSTPQFKKSGNILASALRYVKDVDAYQDNIEKTTPELELANKLISSIADKPEILLILLLFHSELAKMGITPQSNRDLKGVQSWKFQWACMWKLHRIHTVFWEQCQLENISERNHPLKRLPQDVGVLDPKYYLLCYQELQSGVFQGTDFRHVEIVGKLF